MEITDFLTQNFLSSFTGTLVAVELIVFTTKDFPLIKKIPTKLYTFILAVAHLVIVKTTTGSIEMSVECYYRLFINALVIVLILCGGYDTIMEKFKSIKDITGNLISEANDNEKNKSNTSNEEQKQIEDNNEANK